MSTLSSLSRYTPRFLPNQTVAAVRDFSNCVPMLQSLIHGQETSAHPSTVLSMQQMAALVDKTYLVHVTSHLPKGNKILARCNYDIPENVPIRPELRQIFQQSLSIVRPTVHYTLNAVCPEHEEHNRKKADIIILQPVHKTKENISGGYLEDIFSIGSQHLPEGTHVVLPKSYQENATLRNELADFPKGTKISFRSLEENVDDVVKRVLKNYGQESLSPIPVPHPSIPIFVFQGSESKKAHLSSSWMKTLAKPHCMHVVTPMKQIEDMLIGSPVMSYHPFLSVLLNGYKDSSHLLREYISATRAAFPEMNHHQRDLLCAYENALLITLDMYHTSKTVEVLHKSWTANQGLIQRYDEELLVKMDKKSSN